MTRLRRNLLCLGPFAAGSAVYAVLADFTLPIGRLEFAGDAATAAEVTAGRVPEFRDAIAADHPFIVGYTATLVLACLVCWGRGRLGVTGAALAVVAAVCDVVENIALWTGLSEHSDALFARAAVAAGVKFALVGAAAVIAVAGLFRRPG